MIPTGGLSVFIHFIVIVVANIAKRVRFLKTTISYVRIPAPIIGLAICAVILYFATSLFLSALNDDNNFDHLAFLVNTCEEKSVHPDDRTIIIRVDDIQAFAWTDISKRIIDDAVLRGVPISLAVIPIGLRDDFTFYEYLRTNRCMLEFAIHGWDNIEPEPYVGEFAKLSESGAKDRLEKSISVLDRLARDEIKTFVPPLNQLSEGSKMALAELNVPIISSYGNNRFDYDTTTFDFNTDELVTLDRVLTECRQTFQSGEKECVVMVHPQDFVTGGELDETKYQLFTDVLDAFISEGYTFARFKDFKIEPL